MSMQTATEKAIDMGMTVFDTALPQDFWDHVHEVVGLSPTGHIVWCYSWGDVSSITGQPVGVTPVGQAILRLVGRDSRISDVSQLLHTYDIDGKPADDIRRIMAQAKRWSRGKLADQLFTSLSLYFSAPDGWAGDWSPNLVHVFIRDAMDVAGKRVDVT